MRTKHLLMTMALPLAFAACTSDEFESFDQGNGLKNRKEIGQVAIAFENGDALTRWTSGMQPEVGDRVGAVSIDNLKNQEYNEEKPESNYTTSENQIFSNYMYENNGNDMWLTNANLVEGGYYFYAPYVASQTRGLMKLNAPVVQNLDVQDGKIVGNSAIVNFIEEGTTPFYIGYKFLSAAESNTDITVKMRHIFAYPRLEFTNKTGEAVELKRILIQSTGGLIESASLSNTGIGNIETPKGVLYMTGEQKNDAIADAVAAAEDDATAPFNTWGTWSKTFAQDKSLEDLKTTDLLTDVKATSVIRIELESPVTVADDATISFGVVLPAAQFANGTLQVNYVTTDDKAYTWKNDGVLTTMLGDAYVAEDYNEDGSGDLKDAKPMFAFEATEIDEGFEMINLVTSTAELIDVIDANRASTKPLVITLAGEDIEFNESVYNAVSRQKAQGLILNGDIKIVGSKDAEKPLNIERKVKFGNATISGNVQFGKVNSTTNAVGFESIEVEKGAALTIDALATKFSEKEIASNSKIVNNGTLTLKTAEKAVENNGTLNIEAGASIESLSKGDDEEIVPVVNIDNDFEYKGNKIEGNWTVAEEKVITLANETTLPHKSTLTVNGELKGAKLTVSGTLNVNGSLRSNVELVGVLETNGEGAVTKSEVAEMNVGDNAIVRGALNGKENTNTTTITTLKEKFHIRNVQIVNVAEGASFVTNPTYANLLVKQTIEGDVEGATKVNKWVKALEITGNVIGDADLNGYNWNQLDSLTIGGHIQATTAKVSITIATPAASNSTAIRVNGDILAGNKVTLKGASEVQVKGTFETYDKGGLDVSNVKTLILNNMDLREADLASTNWGFPTNNWNVILNGETNVWLNGCGFYGADLEVRGDVTVAEGAKLIISKDKTATVNGNVTISGKGTAYAAGATIKIAKNSKLTNESTIEGTKDSPVKFTREDSTGEVENNGTIKNPNRGDGWQNWWSGNGDVVKD